MYIATLFFVVLSFFVPSTDQGIPKAFLVAIISLSAVQVVLAYAFNLWYMRFYKEKNGWDWALRIALLPEFLYANVLSLALIGAYAYFALDSLLLARYEGVPGDQLKLKNSLMRRIASVFSWIFSALGYSRKWGTR